MDKEKIKLALKQLKNYLAILNLQTNMITKEEHIKYVGKCLRLVEELEEDSK
ncbi:MAG: hypothetical protein AABY22_17620 [Nanoarchaeota archaeon]